MKRFISKIAILLGCISYVGCGVSGNETTDKILSPAEYMNALQNDEKAFLLDVRRAEEYAEGHLPGATLLDVSDSTSFAKGMETLDKEKTMYIYCRSGRRSRTAAHLLTEKGFNVVDLKGGYNAWKEFINNK